MNESEKKSNTAQQQQLDYNSFVGSSVGRDEAAGLAAQHCEGAASKFRIATLLGPGAVDVVLTRRAVIAAAKRVNGPIRAANGVNGSVRASEDAATVALITRADSSSGRTFARFVESSTAESAAESAAESSSESWTIRRNYSS